jgi:2'-5' RNA ligase
MSLLRAFTAIEIPRAIQLAIWQATSPLRNELGSRIRWTPPENIHLTLKFLGDISPASVDDLARALRAAVETIPAFDIQVGGFGSFPNFKRASILWVGTQPPTEVDALYREVESACGRLGFAPESRGFSPHLTIARVKADGSAADRNKILRLLESTTIDVLGAVRVDSAHLFKSDLKPSGAVYTKLFSAPLRDVMLSEPKSLPPPNGGSSPSAQNDTTL